MIRVHVIRWICGRATFVWQYLSDTQVDKLPHLTPAMIHTREMALVAKMVIIGCIGVVPVVPPAVYYGPGIVRGIIGGPPVGGAGAGPSSRARAVPEPGALGFLIVGIGGVWWVRRK